MPKQDKNIRRAAVSILRAWSKGHDYADSLIDKHARKNHLSPSDRGLLNAIILAVLRNRRLLDFYIARLRHGKLDHETRDILRVGLAQLLLLGIPAHAAVNETVNCGRAPVRGLINAVLRKSIDKKKSLLTHAAELPPAELYSHPDWLAKRWRGQFGKEESTLLMQWNNEPAETTLRLNSLRPESADLVGDARLTPLAEVPGFYLLDGPVPREWTEAGLVYMQDPATRHSVELLNPQPGECVLDACAAPGGKAALIAAAMKNEGELLCTDSNELRLPRLEENLSNLGVTIAKTQVFDWTQEPPAEWQQKFDAILLDVPCSNTGVLRRRVDARWRLTPEQIEALTQVQEAILVNALQCLKPTGRIVYSTCSVESDENENLVEPWAKGRNLTVVETRQSLPQRDEQDGAFAALLRYREGL
ncbi:RsmB/NOP family class I SAM-dependent RNA methyltransferase [Roseibacillus ishigakijimensis]|uniref:Methyltransferase domain-containing protein n=1 Tax=Roseibacillus ishigakijimensis TaxID=454146 RepID=A0A934VMP3_9BACT|nr:transcription antitermination factor NusB [Roseibacillus ishigakijimensis]MBK1834170.1 methyltransferase domain-containing protein [Roseibacillus ishigakijimensis]